MNSAMECFVTDTMALVLWIEKRKMPAMVKSISISFAFVTRMYWLCVCNASIYYSHFEDPKEPTRLRL